MKRTLELISIFIIGYLIGAIIGLLIGDLANAKMVKIAIIDTGYDAEHAYGPELKLCKTGHYDFITDTPTVGHTIYHGTEVGSILAQELNNLDYCAIIISVYNPNTAPEIPDSVVVSAYQKAINAGAIVVNYSIVGHTASVVERNAITAAAKKVLVFIAAGNDHLNLNEECLAFPTCFDIPGVYSVGALDGKDRAKYSNYGKRVKLWFSGKGVRGNGTSFAVPRAIAHFVKLVTTSTH